MPKKILIVEDEANIRELLRLYLEREGYTVLEAENGVEGIKKWKSDKPDMLLLDVMMPVMDGWEVCREIRAESDVPIIMLTAKGETADRVSGLEMGADDYIVKPLEMPEVIARVRAVFRRMAPDDAPEKLSFDNLVIDKQAGMPIHPSLNNYYNSLANALAWYFEQQKKPFIFRCVNRLDRDTSGLTIIAKHVVSAAILSSMNARREIHREYRAIVRGHLTPESGVITAPLGRKDSSIIERTVDFDHGEKAVTYYQFLEEKNGHSLVSLRLGTGRTHQIRIHMKYIGFPLVGDYLYNPDMEYITRQALHSYRLTFLHPITGQKMDFTAPLPDDMKKILN